MKLLAISGSARAQSTNTALLCALVDLAPPTIKIEVFAGIGDLPVFSPDREGDATPDVVRAFQQKIAAADGLIIASPEYVRTLPGGLKNAIDWLVSGEHVIGKPIALAHASHRGDDMLQILRTVLSTISSNFNPGIFLRVPLMKQTPESIAEIMTQPANRQAAEKFLADFAVFCRNSRAIKPNAMEL
ncbi:NAD(P)H-dependent FMN reductase [Rhizobium aquaticum]|uniref:NAD(P)H-dependent FMN reductase n=1 Tax=Rhizobium aquaticum TaxID=1549636 RepID=A0ABV2IUX4_9HYPH